MNFPSRYPIALALSALTIAGGALILTRADAQTSSAPTDAGTTGQTRVSK